MPASRQTRRFFISSNRALFGRPLCVGVRKGGRELRVRVEEQLLFNRIALILNAALAGFGLAYLPEARVQPHLVDGRLIRVLDDWCPPFSASGRMSGARKEVSK